MGIRTMIVDDQEDIRVLLRMMIELANGGLEVSCEARSGNEALALLDRCNPAVIVLDEMMPGMNGVETAGHILVRRPRQPVILCSAYLDDDIRARGRDVGVTAFVHKDDITTIPAVIRQVSAA